MRFKASLRRLRVNQPWPQVLLTTQNVWDTVTVMDLPSEPRSPFPCGPCCLVAVFFLEFLHIEGRFRA